MISPLREKTAKFVPAWDSEDEPNGRDSSPALFFKSTPRKEIRAGVFGVRHRDLPGVVHFEYSWNLDSAAEVPSEVNL
jgi:hypothetical protein